MIQGTRRLKDDKIEESLRKENNADGLLLDLENRKKKEVRQPPCLLNVQVEMSTNTEEYKRENVRSSLGGGKLKNVSIWISLRRPA